MSTSPSRAARLLPALLLPALLVPLLVWAPAAAGQDLSDVEIETVRVADGVWMLTGSGGNLGVAAGADGVVLVDDQYAPLTDRILEAVRELGHGDPRFVINTHWHPDHTGGNENMGEAGALLVAHGNVRTRMASEQVLELFGQTVPPSPEGALPVVTFTRELTFHLNGDSVRVVHMPHAHTDGDAIIHFTRADVVHMGDTYFAGTYPFVDLDSGGNVLGILAAVDRVLEEVGPDTRIIPGHGPLSDVDELRGYRDMLSSAVDRVSEARESGMTLEQVLEAAPTSELDAAWGGGFIDPDRFVTSVYRSLERWEEHHPMRGEPGRHEHGGHPDHGARPGAESHHGGSR